MMKKKNIKTTGVEENCVNQLVMLKRRRRKKSGKCFS
jgi:hypothetical protein